MLKQSLNGMFSRTYCTVAHDYTKLSSHDKKLYHEASLILVPLVSMIVPSHHPGKMQVLESLSLQCTCHSLTACSECFLTVALLFMELDCLFKYTAIECLMDHVSRNISTL